jgi:hypothetical protein
MFVVLVTMMIMCGVFGLPSEFVADAQEIPDYVCECASDYLIEQLGYELYESRVSFQRAAYVDAKLSAPGWSYTRNAHYDFTYCFQDPDHSFVRALIHLSVTVQGCQVIPESVRGLPRCVDDPGECSTWIDESEAISIAHNTTFLEGKRKWVATFKFHPKRGTFVWAIQNTLGCRGGAAYGLILFIDANSGEAYRERYHWTAYHGCDDEGEPYAPMVVPQPSCVKSEGTD